jgi:hypothetical protein
VLSVLKTFDQPFCFVMFVLKFSANSTGIVSALPRKP